MADSTATTKIVIKHRHTDTVLYEYQPTEDEQASGLAMRAALEAGVRGGAYLDGANLACANLDGAYLDGAYLAGANLAGANLAGANLARANLTGANLDGANLARATLARAYLDRATLIGANLARANLTEANLARATLDGANLDGATLIGAYLAEANLIGAKWKGGIVINKPPIQLFGLRWRVTILEKHMQIGCELHKLSDWAKYDDARIAAMDGRNALRFWRAHKDVLLGLARSAGCGAATEPAPAPATAE